MFNHFSPQMPANKKTAAYMTKHRILFYVHVTTYA